MRRLKSVPTTLSCSQLGSCKKLITLQDYTPRTIQRKEVTDENMMELQLVAAADKRGTDPKCALPSVRREGGRCHDT